MTHSALPSARNELFDCMSQKVFRQTILHLGAEIKSFSQLSVKIKCCFSVTSFMRRTLAYVYRTPRGQSPACRQPFVCPQNAGLRNDTDR